MVDYKAVIAEKLTGHMKALPALRVMVFGVMILMAMAYGLIYFAGAYMATAGITNSTIAQQYSYIAGNSASPNGGIFAGLSSFNTQQNAQGANFTQASLPTLLVNTLTTVASYFGTVVPMLQTMMFYIGSPFGLFGIPTGYFMLIGTMMSVSLLIIVILTIWAAIYA